MSEQKTRVVHCRKESYDILIDRTTKWGNPFRVEEYGREGSVERYRQWIKTQPQLLADLHELKGKVLGCWCKHKPQPCHGDVLAELAEALA